MNNKNSNRLLTSMKRRGSNACVKELNGPSEKKNAKRTALQVDKGALSHASKCAVTFSDGSLLQFELSVQCLQSQHHCGTCQISPSRALTQFRSGRLEGLFAPLVQQQTDIALRKLVQELLLVKTSQGLDELELGYEALAKQLDLQLTGIVDSL